MKKFIQIHTLTAYPLGNPNRDDLGRPKSAIFGGAPRLRISSQSYKRALRTSTVFQDALSGNMGLRTKRIGELVHAALISDGVDAAEAINITTAVAGIFGKTEAASQTAKTDETKGKKAGKKTIDLVNDMKAFHTRQLAFVSNEEVNYAIDLARKIAAGEKISEKELHSTVLRSADGAVDIALFGRMLANSPAYNREAALQVAHLITTHRAIIEDDYFTAIDDLQRPSDEEGQGAAHMDEGAFGSGVFYGYFCLDTDLLIENLDGDAELAERAVAALVEGVATVTPSGKKAAFAHQAQASYVLLECGDRQPRSLASAFMQPIGGTDHIAASIEAIASRRAAFERSYGPNADVTMILDTTRADGATLAQLVEAAVSPVPADA